MNNVHQKHANAAALEPPPQDTLDRLLVGRATEGDQMLAYNAIRATLAQPTNDCANDLVAAGHFRRDSTDAWHEVSRNVTGSTVLYHAPGWQHEVPPPQAARTFNFVATPISGWGQQSIGMTLATPHPAALPPAQAVELNGAPYGIIDPDYAKVFTIARIIAWQHGYALTLHGSFTRDLDIVMVPWVDRAADPLLVVNRIAELAGLRVNGEPGVKPHGRRAWTLLFPAFGDPRWVDLSVVPRAPSAPSVTP